LCQAGRDGRPLWLEIFRGGQWAETGLSIVEKNEMIALGELPSWFVFIPYINSTRSFTPRTPRTSARERRTRIIVVPYSGE